eukprot:2956025-Prorocentrum_lima.AAC.1
MPEKATRSLKLQQQLLRHLSRPYQLGRPIRQDSRPMKRWRRTSPSTTRIAATWALSMRT